MKKAIKKIQDSCFKKTICLLLALITLAFSASCNRQQDDAEQAFDWSDYVIVTPNLGIPQEDVGFGRKTNMLQEIKEAIEKVSGCFPDHFYESSVPREHEIQIGFTGREESEALKGELRENDWVVAYRNGNFIICGGSDYALLAAIRAFIREIGNIRPGIEDGDLVRYTGKYPELIPVIINGTDIKEFSFSSSEHCTPAHLSFLDSFYRKYGYRPSSNEINYSAYIPLITSERSHYIVFGFGRDFYDGAPEAEEGTAVILCNGSSIMIYTYGEGQDKYKNLHNYLLKVIDEAPLVDGKKEVTIPEGVTIIPVG